MNKSDSKWVREQINKLPHVQYKTKAWQGYKDTYQTAFDKEPLDYKKENKAGFSANCALREFVRKVHALK